MLKLLFKTTAYYIIWQKFKKQILLVLSSIIVIGIIGVIYEDIFKVLKVTNKESVGVLLFFKWFLISFIIGFNIYILRKTSIDNKDEIMSEIKKEDSNNLPEKSKNILKKEKILSSTDLILKKYLNKEGVNND